MYTMTIRNWDEEHSTYEATARKFYDPTLSEYGLEAPEMRLEANMFGELSFTIYDWHPRFNDIQVRRSVIYVQRDGELRMAFRPIKRHMNFNGGVEYTCEELTGLLNDFMRKPHAEMTEMTAAGIINEAISGWREEATNTTVVVAEKSFILKMLNQDKTAFAHLTPNNYGTVANWEEIYMDPHYGDYSWEGYEPGMWELDEKGVAMEELNNALYLLGYRQKPGGTAYGFSPTGNEAVYNFMIYSLNNGGTITQALIDASQHGRFWSLANDTAHQKGVYYDLLNAVLEVLQEMEDGSYYEYTTAYPASFVFDPDHDAPASDVIADTVGDLTVEKTDFVGYWDYLQETLVDEYGGYIVPVWENMNQCRIRYVTDDDLPLSRQSITFGENMVDLFVESDTTDMYTTIIPVKEDGTAWDIKNLNDQQEFVPVETLFRLYGRRDTTKEITATDVAAAYQKLLEYVRSGAPIFKPFIQAKAFDLRYAGVDISYLTWMERIPIVSERHEVLESYPIRAATVVLDSPDANDYEMGEEPPSIVDQINDEVRALEKKTRQGS